MSSLAQEESRSISENVTWGQRKRFSDGKITLPYKCFLGYEKGETKDDPPVINPEQAELVRRIYTEFMHGKTTYGIAKMLTAVHIPTPAGKEKWRSKTIESILTNEKYRGSARLQKKFTVDFLTKKMKPNEGEVPQYYIEESHEAIIDPAEWDAVQDEMERRKAIGKAYSGRSVLSTKIVCGDCGAWYGSKVWHSTDKYRMVIWQCNAKFADGKKRCTTPHISEEEIKRRFLAAYNSLITDKNAVIEACIEVKDILTDTSKEDFGISELNKEIEVIVELTKKCINENSSEAQDQEEFNEKYNGYVEKYEKAKKCRDALSAKKEQKISVRRNIERFIADLSVRDELLTEFDDCLWLAAVERVTVKNDGVLVFRLYSGTEVEN